jgi:hypothetical protein
VGDSEDGEGGGGALGDARGDGRGKDGEGIDGLGNPHLAFLILWPGTTRSTPVLPNLQRTVSYR